MLWKHQSLSYGPQCPKWYKKFYTAPSPADADSFTLHHFCGVFWVGCIVFGFNTIALVIGRFYCLFTASNVDRSGGCSASDVSTFSVIHMCLCSVSVTVILKIADGNERFGAREIACRELRARKTSGR